MNKFYKCCTFNMIYEDNAARNFIIVQHKWFISVNFDGSYYASSYILYGRDLVSMDEVLVGLLTNVASLQTLPLSSVFGFIGLRNCVFYWIVLLWLRNSLLLILRCTSPFPSLSNVLHLFKTFLFFLHLFLVLQSRCLPRDFSNILCAFRVSVSRAT
jgi:hypothetical protein